MILGSLPFCVGDRPTRLLLAWQDDENGAGGLHHCLCPAIDTVRVVRSAPSSQRLQTLVSEEGLCTCTDRSARSSPFCNPGVICRSPVDVGFRPPTASAALAVPHAPLSDAQTHPGYGHPQLRGGKHNPPLELCAYRPSLRVYIWGFVPASVRFGSSLLESDHLDTWRASTPACE